MAAASPALTAIGMQKSVVLQNRSFLRQVPYIQLCDNEGLQGAQQRHSTRGVLYHLRAVSTEIELT